MTSLKRAEIFEKLQTDILRLQGFKQLPALGIDLTLGPILDAFPNTCFPVGAVHEFLSSRPEDSAATTGFITGLLSCLMKTGGVSVWIGSNRSIFPPALRHFGIQPDRMIFLNLHNEKDILWSMEEALRCGVLAAVVAETSDLSFTTSRRLQLAVEQSNVTGFVLRRNARKLDTTASICRWRITSLPGVPIAIGTGDNFPGIGFPQWRVELLRVRNGRPGVWDVSWMNGEFHSVLHFPADTYSSRETRDEVSSTSASQSSSAPSTKHRKAG